MRNKEKRYYIAYGSNLSVDQMTVRCPDAKIVGKAMLPDWRLIFRFYATIEPCDGKTVPVLVWEISEKDERKLDFYEGFPTHYIKQEMEIIMTDLDGNHPRTITAMVYLMTEGRKIRMPMPVYERIIREGYRRFGFDMKILHDALKETGEAEEYEIP